MHLTPILPRDGHPRWRPCDGHPRSLLEELAHHVVRHKLAWYMGTCVTMTLLLVLFDVFLGLHR